MSQVRYDPIYIWLDVSGSPTVLNSNLPRPDVAAVYPVFGPNHGYAQTIAKPPGSYRVCAWANNTGAGQSTPLGCRDVTVR